MLSIEVTGQKELEVRLSKILSALDVRHILDEMTALLLARIRSRYLAETDPDGIKWVRSAAAIHRASTGRGGGTLFDTGRLFHSIQSSVDDANTRSIGTNVPYGPQHNFGTNGQVRRTFLGFGAQDVKVATDLVNKRLQDAFE